MLDGVSEDFDSSSATVMTGTRSSLEYLDADHLMAVAEANARWAVQAATQAVGDAASFLEADADR